MQRAEAQPVQIQSRPLLWGQRAPVLVHLREERPRYIRTVFGFDQ